MPDTNLTEQRPFTIVVAVDLADTPSGGFALDQAARIGLRIRASQLHVLHVSRDEPTQETLGLLRMYDSEKMAALEGGKSVAVAAHVRRGDPGQQIAQFASDLAADIILVGTHGPAQLKSLVLGSTAERVMAHAHCPVLVAGPRPKPAESHVIVIEAPCPDCVRARLESRGRTWWCARHAEHHAVLRHHHLYSYSGPEFAEHDSEASATGVDTE
jgi:nucleotide-binding universal stress UspA family protein